MKFVLFQVKMQVPGVPKMSTKKIYVTLDYNIDHWSKQTIAIFCVLKNARKGCHYYLMVKQSHISKTVFGHPVKVINKNGDWELLHYWQKNCNRQQY